ncbi:Repressible high-affinity phosphate permease [Cytospora mali]|uniref:Repressible high-affinity phosphate permease n=1 Tax=Cytospora mali TaxID=578113 RepID=A0A194VWF0_CYTMA|nr:Repressible high-affinity phosphate permease [Valsa mali]
MEVQPESVASSYRTYGGNRAFHNFANDYSHIQDPNLRRRLALSDVDRVPFGLYHVRAVLVAGIGFFLDSYDIFAINLVTIFLGLVFWQGPPEDARNGYGGNNGVLPGPVSQALKTSTSAGVIIGQVLFGWLADYVGRRKMYGVELGIILLATFNCALTSPSQSMSSTALLVFHRVVLGIGIGGDYPLSSVITAEFAPTRWRGSMMAAVFSMQGLGQLCAATVALVVTVAFKDSFLGIEREQDCDYACQSAADRCWRLIIGVGTLPALFALYYRITIPETPRYTFDVAHDVEKADADITAYMARKPEGHVDKIRQARLLKLAGPSLSTPAASWQDLGSYFGKWKNLEALLGTTLSWFFLDIAFYGLGLNSSIFLEPTGYANGHDLYHKLYNNAVGLMILSIAGSIPGYWTAVLTIDTVGRKTLQVFGFVALIPIFCILGFAYYNLNSHAMLALYAIAQFLFNLGPNTTTFIVPGECFPTRYRATAHGVSAAAGKVGAIAAQAISLPFLTRDSSARPDRLMQIFALSTLCGALTSLLIPETKGFTLEELAGEQPTSYNSDRNGRITVHSSARRRWNPFVGGQPAGFMYSRARGVKKVWWRRGPRMGVDRPEMAATVDPETGRSTPLGGKGWWRKRKGHEPVSRNGDWSGSRTSFTRPINTRSVSPPGNMPTWHAGWGSIDRGAPTPDNIQLHDVGGLVDR